MGGGRRGRKKKKRCLPTCTHHALKKKKKNCHGGRASSVNCRSTPGCLFAPVRRRCNASPTFSSLFERGLSAGQTAETPERYGENAGKKKEKVAVQRSSDKKEEVDQTTTTKKKKEEGEEGGSFTTAKLQQQKKEEEEEKKKVHDCSLFSFFFFLLLTPVDRWRTCAAAPRRWCAVLLYRSCPCPGPSPGACRSCGRWRRCRRTCVRAAGRCRRPG